jgi:lactoylglutathione lyase
MTSVTSTAMSSDSPISPNVRQAVPFFRVTSMDASLRFYVDGIGCEMTESWMPEGELRWCWLKLGDAALMLQQYARQGQGSLPTAGKLGEGVSICFICQDAVAFYREVTARGLDATRPFVGNRMWVTTLYDPDGYRLEFESMTDVPEETVLPEDEA